jgi:hypothetical protein
MKKAFWLCALALMLFPAFVYAAGDDPLGNVLLAEEKMPANPLPEYWLGIQCRPALEALRTQLRLPEGEGIVVEGVVPDSPAAKAGLVKYDVILKVDNKKISDISDLQQAVEAAKEKEVKLAIIRDGQPKTIAVTPAKRPEEAVVPAPRPENELEALRNWIEQMQPGARFDRQGPMQFRIFRAPGIILPPGAPIHPPLPGNMSITITKTGDKPADISVKLGDEKWDVTEKDLDKLPDKVRPYVERMLGQATGIGPGATRWMSELLGPANPPEQPPGPGGPPPQGPSMGPGPGLNMPPMSNIEKRIERRLEEMSQRIERLQRELHERRQGERGPEKPPPEERPNQPAPEKSEL